MTLTTVKTTTMIGKIVISNVIVHIILGMLFGLLLLMGASLTAVGSAPPGAAEFLGRFALIFILPVAVGGTLLTYAFLASLSRVSVSGGDTNHPAASDAVALRRAARKLARLPLFVFLRNALLVTAMSVAFSVAAGTVSFNAVFRVLVVSLMSLAGSAVFSFVELNVDYGFLAQLYKTIGTGGVDQKPAKSRFGVRFNLNVLFFCLTAFTLFFVSQVIWDLHEIGRYQSAVLEAAAEGRVTGEEAAAAWREYRAGGAVSERLAGLTTMSTEESSRLPLMAGLLALIGIIAIFPVSADIRRRVISQRSLIENILTGNDFSLKRILVTRIDEIGATSRAMNRFIDKFSEILKAIFSSADAVQTVSGSLDRSLSNASVAIEEMVATIKQITGNTTTQMDVVTTIRAKLEEMLIGIDGTSFDVVDLSNFVQETSSAMHETTVSIQTISKNTDQVNELANRLVDISRDGSDSVKDTVTAINEIQKAAAQVSNIVDIISAIAQQTNMLSLNASIEAAHAGEKGKGFAVVAEEIRKLAEQSNENIALIAKQIDNMNEKVKIGVELTTAADDAFQKIHEDINLTTQHINHVTVALQEQNAGTRQIMTALEEMVNKTVEVKEISEDLKRMSEEIHAFMEELYNISLQINDATGEQNKGNRDILTLVTTVKDASQKNLSVVENLQMVINDYQKQKSQVAEVDQTKLVAG
ncbi:MAG TPA: hypothetical protein ENN69_03375 [Spirochaetia bacterium]|nr:hypothetical protein [Spirochaetia bacterium]